MGRLSCFSASALSVLLAGCQMRSISDSGYRGPGQGTPELYQGELHELDVIGLDPGDLEVTPTGGPRLVRDQKVLLIQSGAMIPDSGMFDALSEHFEVGTMSGIPRQPGDPQQNIRTAAARGGYGAIICYWGVLESSRAATPGKAALWIPIARYFVEDEDQRVRMRLKVAVIDVATGNWMQMFPTPSEDVAASAMFSREVSDQAQVARVKFEGYRSACRELVDALVD